MTKEAKGISKKCDEFFLYADRLNHALNTSDWEDVAHFIECLSGALEDVRSEIDYSVAEDDEDEEEGE